MLPRGYVSVVFIIAGGTSITLMSPCASRCTGHAASRECAPCVATGRLVQGHTGAGDALARFLQARVINGVSDTQVGSGAKR